MKRTASPFEIERQGFLGYITQIGKGAYTLLVYRKIFCVREEKDTAAGVQALCCRCKQGEMVSLQIKRLVPAF